MNISKELKQRLAAANYSNTKTRQKLFAILQRCEPLTLPQLAHQAKGSLDRASVYRTIELFEELGVVHRIWQGFKSRIELSDEFAPHHHHITCLNCKKTINLESSSLERLVENLSKKYGVKAVNHEVEITGYCQTCQRKSY